MTNEKRAAVVEHAVNTFRDITHSDTEDIISDMICDLLHLARSWGQDPERELLRGTNHFRYEETPEGQEEGALT